MKTPKLSTIKFPVFEREYEHRTGVKKTLHVQVQNANRLVVRSSSFGKKLTDEEGVPSFNGLFNWQMEVLVTRDITPQGVTPWKVARTSLDGVITYSQEVTEVVLHVVQGLFLMLPPTALPYFELLWARYQVAFTAEKLKSDKKKLEALERTAGSRIYNPLFGGDRKVLPRGAEL